MARRRHEPTDKTRAEVSALSQFGVTEADTATYIGIDAKTLRKYYREELDKAHIKANVKVANALFNQAVNKGNVSAQIFWLKARAGWSEKNDEDLALDRQLKRAQIQKVQKELELLEQSPKDHNTVAALLGRIIDNMPD